MTKTPKVRVSEVRPAGENHQVVTVVREGETEIAYRRTPCQECPWKVDSPIGAFPAEAYRHSAATAYDMAGNTFACHMKGAKAPAICAGFLLRGAHHNRAVRMNVMKGKIDLGQVQDDGCELYASYRDMAEANGVDPDDESLRRCRE